MSDPILAAGEPTPDPGAEISRGGPSRHQDKPRSLAGDAWHELRRKPMFVASLLIILIVVVMAALPGLFTHVDPNAADLDHVRQGPSPLAWFGYDVQGSDVFSRVIYGTRASLLVGALSTTGTVAIGGIVGIVAGYYGRLTDSVLSRFADIFAGMPFVLGAIVILMTFNAPGSNPGEVRIITQVVLSIAVLSWPVAMRIMRAATLVAKQQDYVKAARGLGAGPLRIIVRHLLPNTVAPVLVYSTISLGANIGAEATLSYLGIGLRPPVVSWGVMISDAKDYFTVAPHMLLFPAAFVSITVLAFVMLGDAVRDAFDPKSR
jgi:oligopeptide transport system permease protein